MNMTCGGCDYWLQSIKSCVIFQACAVSNVIWVSIIGKRKLLSRLLEDFPTGSNLFVVFFALLQGMGWGLHFDALWDNPRGFASLMCKSTLAGLGVKEDARFLCGFVRNILSYRAGNQRLLAENASVSVFRLQPIRQSPVPFEPV